MSGKIKVVTQSPSDRNTTSYLHPSIAWAAAQGIARTTHHRVILYGTYGMVRFDSVGGGIVEWNEKSTEPDSVTHFGSDTTVCVI